MHGTKRRAAYAFLFILSSATPLDSNATSGYKRGVIYLTWHPFTVFEPTGVNEIYNAVAIIALTPKYCRTDTDLIILPDAFLSISDLSVMIAIMNNIIITLENFPLPRCAKKVMQLCIELIERYSDKNFKSVFA